MSLMIGIDESNGFIFEGTSTYGGHLVFPTPVITEASFVDASNSGFQRIPLLHGTRYYFREDSFDPVSRIRRGRFYKSNGSSEGWHVRPHPLVQFPYSCNTQNGVLFTTSIFSGLSFHVASEFTGRKPSNLAVVLGNERASSIWSIIHVESGLAREELVTLKARKSFGVLPMIKQEQLPENSARAIEEALQQLEDDYHLASPDSVVDRANEAATRILNGFLAGHGKDSQDNLNNAIKKMNGLGKDVAKDAADIVRLFHGRTKYSVQVEKDTRIIREQDAELAVQCIGVMLCDLDWAEWQ